MVNDEIERQADEYTPEPSVIDRSTLLLWNRSQAGSMMLTLRSSMDTYFFSPDKICRGSSSPTSTLKSKASVSSCDPPYPPTMSLSGIGVLLLTN